MMSEESRADVGKGMEFGGAADWELLGEGGANVVLGYRGSHPALVKCLRRRSVLIPLR